MRRPVPFWLALAIAVASAAAGQGAVAQSALPQTGTDPDAGIDAAPIDPEAERTPADGEVRSLFRLAPPPPEGMEAAPTTWSDPTYLRPASKTLPASVAQLRLLDKMSGSVESFDLAVGSATVRGRLEITLDACRIQPPELPQDAWAHLKIRDERDDAPRFDGWMIASTPALSALDHQRYDVWVTSCSTASAEASDGSAKKSD
jgi:hypothetical protein